MKQGRKKYIFSCQGCKHKVKSSEVRNLHFETDGLTEAKGTTVLATLCPHCKNFCLVSYGVVRV